MNTNALTKLTYGLYILSSRHHDESSGCIIDTCIQAGTDPDQILISVMNSNHTKKIIKKSGVFCISILCENCPFEIIKHFGYQSSKDVNKFEGLTTYTDINCVPFVLSYVCATISAKVIDSIDLGSHTVFIGKVNNQKVLSNNRPMTYLYYQEKVKPKFQEANKALNMPTSANSSFLSNTIQTQNGDKKIIGWKCTICGHIYDDPDIPMDYICPICGHHASDCIPIYA